MKNHTYSYPRSVLNNFDCVSVIPYNLAVMLPVSVGSDYCDDALRIGGFSGESLCSGAVLVVKTHKDEAPPWTAQNKPNGAKGVS